VESKLTMDPPGPVVVFNTSILTAGRSEKSLMTRFNDEYSNPIILTCNTSENYSITWDLPENAFSELNDYVPHQV